MHELSTSTSNITTYAKESKHATSTTRIPQPAKTLLTASPNPSHAPNFMSSRRGWACATTFQLEGGCWKYTGQVGTASLYFRSPHEHLWVRVDSSPPLSRLTPTSSATEVSHLITTQKPSLTCIVPES